MATFSERLRAARQSNVIRGIVARENAPGVVASATSYVTGMLSGVAQSTLTNSATREGYYHSNWASVNIVPPLDQCLAAYYSGQLTADQIYDLCGWNGVAFDLDKPLDELNTVPYTWRTVIDLARPRLDAATCANLWHQNEILAPEYRTRLKRSGLPNEDIDLLLRQTPVADLGAASEWYRSNLITEAELREIMRRNGANDAVSWRVIPALKNPLPIDQIVTWRWLDRFTEQEAFSRMRQSGMSEAAEVNMALNFKEPWGAELATRMRWRHIIGQTEWQQEVRAEYTRASGREAQYMRAMRPMPGVGDLTKFAVREVWDETVVARFGYDAEFPPQLSFYLGMQGAEWTQDIRDATGAVTPGVPWSKAYWRSHWQTMAIGNAYDAYHRLRPGRFQRYAERVPGVTEFSWADLETTIRIADYPPRLRPILAALSFRTMESRRLRQLYQQGIINDSEMVAYLEDGGYLPADALRIFRGEAAVKSAKEHAAALAAERRAQTCAIRNVEQAFEDGFIERAPAVDQLVLAGMTQGAAIMLLDCVTARVRHKILVTMRTAIHRDYMEGAFSDGQAMEALQRIGVTPLSSLAYVNNWKAERGLNVRMASTGQILSWVKGGQLDARAAQVRLANLGWNTTDALLALQQAQGGLNVSRGRAIAASSAKAAARARQLQAVQAKAAALQRRAQNALKALTPRSVLKQWLADGVVSEAFVRSRLAAMGYPPAAVDTYIEGWNAKAKAKASGKGKGKPPGAATGGSTPNP